METDTQQDQSTPLQPTPVGQWKKKRVEGFLTTLPSGNVARIRRTMDLMMLVRSGKIPNPLRGILQKSINTGGSQSSVKMDDFNAEALEQFIDLLNDTIVACFLEPKVEVPPAAPKDPGDEATEEEKAAWHHSVREWEAWQPSDDAISINDVDMEDKMYVFTVSHGMVADVATFRNLSASGLASLSNGEGVRNPTQPATAR